MKPSPESVRPLDQSQDPERDVFEPRDVFVVRADSPLLTRASADLAGNAGRVGARGSGLVILSRYVLDGLGLKARDEDFQSVYLDRPRPGRPRRLVQDGRVAALIGGRHRLATDLRAIGGEPQGALPALHRTPMPTRIARIRAKHTFIKPLTVPAGSYQTKNA